MCTIEWWQSWKIYGNCSSWTTFPPFCSASGSTAASTGNGVEFTNHRRSERRHVKSELDIKDRFCCISPHHLNIKDRDQGALITIIFIYVFIPLYLYWFLCLNSFSSINLFASFSIWSTFSCSYILIYEYFLICRLKS